MNKLKNLIIRKCKKYIDERGEIYISEINKILKMKIERIFIVYGKKNKIRGKHAHKLCNQVIFLINGKIQIIISDGNKKKIFNLSNIGEYILIPCEFWAEQKFLTENSKIMVCCDRKYEKNDYLYSLSDLKEFRKNA